jgi:hypothetical protein
MEIEERMTQITLGTVAMLFVWAMFGLLSYYYGIRSLALVYAEIAIFIVYFAVIVCIQKLKNVPLSVSVFCFGDILVAIPCLLQLMLRYNNWWILGAVYLVSVTCFVAIITPIGQRGFRQSSSSVLSKTLPVLGAVLAGVALRMLRKRFGDVFQEDLTPKIILGIIWGFSLLMSIGLYNLPSIKGEFEKQKAESEAGEG